MIKAGRALIAVGDRIVVLLATLLLVLGGRSGEPDWASYEY